MTLFDRFVEPVPIGSGLMIQPTGQAVLAELGLLPQVLAEGSRIERLVGCAGGRTVLDVHYHSLGGLPRFGIGVHRSNLFDTLYDAVRSNGVALRSGADIVSSELDRNGRRLVLRRGERTEPFDLVVDALGARSTLTPTCGRTLDYGALWATLDWPDGAGFQLDALEQRYRRSSIMVGVLPIGLGRGHRLKTALFWSLRSDALDAWRTAGLEAWKQDVRALWSSCAPLLEQIERPEQLTFARYSHRTLPHPVEPALIHIGDAWHSASPQLGQGANMALLDAWALDLGLSEAETVGQGLERTVSMRRGHIRLYQWLTALFTPVYQSDSWVLPLLRDRLVGPISKLWPATFIQAAMVSGLVGNPLGRCGLLYDR